MKMKSKSSSALAGITLLALLLSLFLTPKVGANSVTSPEHPASPKRDGILFSDVILFSDSTTANSTNFIGKSVLVNGDNTACMK